MFDALRIIYSWMHRSDLRPDDYKVVILARNAPAKARLEAAIRRDPVVVHSFEHPGFNPEDFRYSGIHVLLKEAKR